MQDVVVIGGGVIGLSVARELARAQVGSILLLERDAVGQGTSRAAAGMLSPQSEADNDGPFFQLCMASLRMYRPFAEELKESSGVDPECDESGLLVLASSEEELATLQKRYEWQRT